MSRKIMNVLLEPADLKLIKKVLDAKLEVDDRGKPVRLMAFGVADRDRAQGVCALLEAHIKTDEPRRGRA